MRLRVGARVGVRVRLRLGVRVRVGVGVGVGPGIGAGVRAGTGVGFGARVRARVEGEGRGEGKKGNGAPWLLRRLSSGSRADSLGAIAAVRRASSMKGSRITACHARYERRLKRGRWYCYSHPSYIYC